MLRITILSLLMFATSSSHKEDEPQVSSCINQECPVVLSFVLMSMVCSVHFLDRGLFNHGAGPAPASPCGAPVLGTSIVAGKVCQTTIHNRSTTTSFPVHQHFR